MSKHLWFASIMLLGLQPARALEIPLHPAETRIVEQIIAVEGHLVEAVEVPGWAKGGVVNRLKEWGIETANLKSWGIQGSVKFFEGHPNLEAFTVAEFGNVSQAALASIVKMPKVTRVGFQEAFITYEGGFQHLLPMKGRLETLDLSMSVVNADDLKRVQADHPEAKIMTIPPAEIVKRHSGVANRLARIATGEAAEDLKKAIQASK